MAISDLPGYEHEQQYTIIGFWLEALIYGAYFTTFVKAIRVMLNRWTHTSRVFFVGIWMMFILTSVVTCIKGYTMILAYGKIDDGVSPLSVVHKFDRWDIVVNITLVNCVVWIGDFLAIYRCFIVWGNRWLVVVFPTLLLMSSIAKAIYNIHWFMNLHDMSLLRNALLLLRLCYPFSFAQNVLTTGLIVYKIWDQHRLSHTSGLRAAGGSGSISLMHVLYIIVESAMGFTLLMLCLTIMYETQHRSLVILQACIAPCASMIFVIMSVRMDSIRNRKHIERSVAFPSISFGSTVSDPSIHIHPSELPAGSWSIPESEEKTTEKISEELEELGRRRSESEDGISTRSSRRWL